MSIKDKYTAKWRAAKVAQGLCPRCGKRKRAFLSLHCQKCIDARSVYNKRRHNMKIHKQLRVAHKLK